AMGIRMPVGHALDLRAVCPINVVRSLGLLAPDPRSTGLRLPGLVFPDLRLPNLSFFPPSGTHLRKPQKRDGPDEHWLGLDPDLERLVKGLERLVAHEAKLLVWAEFRHDVVVVSVKPLGHLERGNTTVFAVPPPGHGKVGV